MEKFGIFELLDTLSALADTQETAKEEQKDAAPNAADAAFAPPTYGDPPADGNAETRAITSLLERHDEISKRIDKRK